MKHFLSLLSFPPFGIGKIYFEGMTARSSLFAVNGYRSSRRAMHSTSLESKRVRRERIHSWGRIGAFHPSVFWGMREITSDGDHLPFSERQKENSSSPSTTAVRSDATASPLQDVEPDHPSPLSSFFPFSSTFDFLPFPSSSFSFSSASTRLVAKDAVPFVRSSAHTNFSKSLASSPLVRDGHSLPKPSSTHALTDTEKRPKECSAARQNTSSPPPTTTSRPSSASPVGKSHSSFSHMGYTSPPLPSRMEIKGERKRTVLKRKSKRAVMAISSLLVNHHHRHRLSPSANAMDSSTMAPHNVGSSVKTRTLPVASSAKPFTEPYHASTGGAVPHASPSLSRSEVRESEAVSHGVSSTAPDLTPSVTNATSRPSPPPSPSASFSPAVQKAQEAIAAAAADWKRVQKSATSDTPSGEKMKPKTSGPQEEDPSWTSAMPKGRQEHEKEEEGDFHKRYEEHRILGWSVEQVYRVVSDVDHYSEFLPWCVSSVVHGTPTPVDLSSAVSSRTPVGPSEDSGGPHRASPMEVTATLMVGFSFFKEAYTSLVRMEPPFRVLATLNRETGSLSSSSSDTSTSQAGRVPLWKKKKKCLHEEENTTVGSVGEGSEGGFFSNVLRRAVGTVLHAPPFRPSNSNDASGEGSSGGSGRRRRGSVLRQLRSEWVLRPVPNQPQCVDVNFFVAFQFSNPMYGALIMSNVVSLMTHSFERRCEALYGPPSRPSQAIK